MNIKLNHILTSTIPKRFHFEMMKNIINRRIVLINFAGRTKLFVWIKIGTK